MRALSISLSVVLLASAAAPAFAASRLSDGELVRASRCLGLSKSANLGEADVSTLQAFVKAQARGRDPLVQDRAETAERDARNLAVKASDTLKASLIAERDGACKALVERAAGA